MEIICKPTVEHEMHLLYKGVIQVSHKMICWFSDSELLTSDRREEKSGLARKKHDLDIAGNFFEDEIKEE